MLRTRIIPVLLLKEDGLVKSVKFDNDTYVGDPMNAIKIFNDKEVDELIFLDIEATRKSKKVNIDYIRKIASECFMPLCYGGGISSLADIKEILKAGVEKVAINSIAVKNPEFIKSAASAFGSSTIVVSIDYKRNLFGKNKVVYNGGKEKTNIDPVLFAKQAEELGAGELLVNSVDQDGTMKGYDYPTLQAISQSVKIPVIACGGAGTMEDFSKAVRESGASAVAAGSMFVFKGKHRAVLINYPNQADIKKYITN